MHPVSWSNSIFRKVYIIADRRKTENKEERKKEKEKNIMKMRYKRFGIYFVKFTY